MTDEEFTKRATGAMRRLGATDVVAIATKELLGASCKFRGERYEMSVERGEFDDSSKEHILDGIARMERTAKPGPS